MLKEKLTSLKVRLGESGEEIELPITTVRAENDCDCYRVNIGGTPVGEWLNSFHHQGPPIVCEVIGIQNIIVSNAKY
jgi:hypothetical protein